MPSPAFAGPRIFIRDFPAVARPPLTSASIGFGRREDLAGVRRFLRTQLAQAGFGASLTRSPRISPRTGTRLTATDSGWAARPATAWKRPRTGPGRMCGC